MTKPLIPNRTLRTLRRIDESAMPQRCTIRGTVEAKDGRGGTKQTPNVLLATDVPCRIQKTGTPDGKNREITADELAVIAPWSVVVPLTIRVDATTKAYTTDPNVSAAIVHVVGGAHITVAADDQNPTVRSFDVTLPVATSFPTSVALACKETTV